MQWKTQWIARIGVSVVLFGLLGCGKSVHPVKGTVTFEGKPLPGGGMILFLPLGKQTDKVATGTIAEDGTYRLTTNRPGDGTKPGEYRVVIMQATETEPTPTPDGTPRAAPMLSVAPADRIPALYADHYKSPLTVKVEAKAANEFDFELKHQ